KRSPIQTKKGTEQYEAELVKSALFGSPDTPEKEETGFDKFAVEFLERHVRVQCKYSTLVTYESALREHLVPFFGEVGLAEISEPQIAELQAKLVQEGKPAKTVRNILGVLAAALRMACEWRYLEERPRIRHPKDQLTRFRYLSLADCAKLEEDGATKYWFA